MRVIPTAVQEAAALLTDADFEDVDAVLLGANRMGFAVGKAYLSGYIYGDKKQRFSDGDFVYTSNLNMIAGDVAATLNSRYRVRFAEEAQ
ncbi:hypothetical protein KIKIMORA_02450 [Brevundimonas phage vB_BpoS-Kikimora]|uniref:Uncharacterized protein n=1 Tax=Brevundimonas phage vB_BpoS-Kikimora TaxID=2948601 RepID=A0A9E7MR87_9CAUD|nr:hypothetical protein KIKIMORA_02450 [Brevundimonas phage vB_BpoS-Kikimora]